MDGAREGGALSQHSEAVAQVCHVVLGLHFVGVERFVTLHSKRKKPLSLYFNTSRNATELLLT